MEKLIESLKIAWKRCVELNKKSRGYHYNIMFDGKDFRAMTSENAGYQHFLDYDSYGVYNNKLDVNHILRKGTGSRAEIIEIIENWDNN